MDMVCLNAQVSILGDTGQLVGAAPAHCIVQACSRGSNMHSGEQTRCMFCKAVRHSGKHAGLEAARQGLA